MNDLRYRILLQDELQRVDELLLSLELDIPAPIAESLRALINSGGKRLRPALGILSAYLCNARMEQAIPVSAATEMLHTATLIHDDLVDGANVRRGIPTINSRWNAAASVLVGDAAFAWAAQLGARGKNFAVVDRFGETLKDICRGELNQLFHDRARIPTREEYFDRIYAKTASLFQFTMEIGPVLAARPETEIQLLGRFGKLLGMAFQIEDDILDFTGDFSAVGKPVGSDLIHGLVTLPVLYYMEEVPHDSRIATILAGPADPTMVKSLVLDLRRSRACELSQAAAVVCIEEALNLLSSYPISPYREALEQIAYFSINRPY